MSQELTQSQDPQLAQSSTAAPLRTETHQEEAVRCSDFREEPTRHINQHTTSIHTTGSFYESFDFSDAESEEELLFDTPELLGAPEAALELRPIVLQATSLQGHTIQFRGNYRQSIARIVLSLMLATPCLCWLLWGYGGLLAVQLSLSLATAIGALGCLFFYWGRYQRRGILVDDFGLHYEDELRELYIAWGDIKEIHLHAVEAFFNPYPLCYVKATTFHGDVFAFSNFGSHLFGTKRDIFFGNPPYPIVDIRDADLLLVLLTQQAKRAEAAPDLERLWFRAQAEPRQWEEDDKQEASAHAPSKPRAWVGFWALAMKLGTKMFAPLLKLMAKFAHLLPKGAQLLLKSVKPIYAGASLGLYAVFFSWKFALMLMLTLLIHELGHVWAMYRAGMKVRGIYMLPFFGAATVAEEMWPSWYEHARVNLAGPLWGTYSTIVFLVLHLIFPSPFWIGLALWSALINFLNLLPVHPLDGGRILNAVAYSLRSRAGFVVTILMLCIGVLLSLSFGLVLLYLMCMFAIAEFFREYMTRQRANKLLLLQNYQRFNAPDLLLLRSITGINFGDRHTDFAIRRQEAEDKRIGVVLHAPTMTRQQLVRVGITSALLFFSLFACLAILSLGYPKQAAWALQLFR